MYDKVCERCGTKLSEYYQTGMLGCPECYNAFRTEIISTLSSIQKSTEHTGKSISYGLDKELISEYKRLLAEKELAVMADALENPVRPFVAVLGGAKVADRRMASRVGSTIEPPADIE